MSWYAAMPIWARLLMFYGVWRLARGLHRFFRPAREYNPQYLHEEDE